jgi:hypothetical protein
MQTLAAAFSLLITLLLFFIFLAVIYYPLRLFWGRLPAAMVSLNADQIPKALGILLSLIFYPALISFAWDAAQNLLRYLADVMGIITNLKLPESCFAESDPSARCGPELSQYLSGLLANVSTGFVRALRLEEFPVISFVWFLLTAIIIAQVIGILY